MYLDSFIKEECTGCSACVSVCAHSAISMQVDSEGFSYPQVNLESCVNCGLCRKVCPIPEHFVTNFTSPAVYAAYLKNPVQRERSSSGGLFYAFAKFTIENGGIVFGATMDSDCKVHHIGTDSLDGLDSLRGSKYVQSEMENVFHCVKTELEKGRQVYFVGTPCQVAGLRRFLLKEYDNLLTSDLICHGTPSQKLLDEHIKYREKQYRDKVLSIQFRDNVRWNLCEILEFEKRGEIRYQSCELSPYLYSFKNLLTLRPSCYECKFSVIPRQGDITLADFWGVKDLFPDIQTSAGVSMILVNSAKGKDALRNILPEVELYKSDLKDAIAHNYNLTKASERPKERNTIYSRIAEEGYSKLAETTFRGPNWKKLYFKNKLYSFLLSMNALQILYKVKSFVK